MGFLAQALRPQMSERPLLKSGKILTLLGEILFLTQGFQPGFGFFNKLVTDQGKAGHEQGKSEVRIRC